MGNIEKMKNLHRNRTRNSIKGIFHTFKDGDNILRLLGEFVEVRTHFIAPAKKRGERGLCMQEAFEGDDKIPQVINCSDWDITKEAENKEKTCVICKLNKWAKDKQNSPSITSEEKELCKAISALCYPRRSLKWNVIDRDDPYVVEQTETGEKKVLGAKIATVGMEAWDDIEKIFHQLGFDITDPEKGIDLCINKGSNGARVKYSVQSVMKGLSVKQTPLTEAEKALVQHDLKKICGSTVDQEKVFNALHVDYRSYLEDSGLAVNSPAESTEETPAAETPAAETPAEETTEVTVTETSDDVPPEVEEPAETPAPSPAAKTVVKATAVATPAAVVKKKDNVVVTPKTSVAAKPVTKPVTPAPKVEDAGENEEIDISEYECFGTIDEKHPECLGCEGREKCKQESLAKK